MPFPGRNYRDLPPDVRSSGHSTGPGLPDPSGNLPPGVRAQPVPIGDRPPIEIPPDFLRNLELVPARLRERALRGWLETHASPRSGVEPVIRRLYRRTARVEHEERQALRERLRQIEEELREIEARLEG